MALFGKPKFSNGKTQPTKRDISGDWTKCKGCNEIVNYGDLRVNNYVCDECNYHYPLTAYERIKLLTDNDSFIELDKDMTSINPLEF